MSLGRAGLIQGSGMGKVRRLEGVSTNTNLKQKRGLIFSVENKGRHFPLLLFLRKFPLENL